jgi:hypothetical protein
VYGPRRPPRLGTTVDGRARSRGPSTSVDGWSSTIHSPYNHYN